jgi:hypothetical protein
MGTIPKKSGFGSRKRTTDILSGLVVGGHTIPTLLTFVFAQNATQYGTECEISVCNKDGQVIPGIHMLDVYLTDSATGEGLTATDPTGSVTAKSASGTIIQTAIAKKLFKVVTLPTGKFTLQIIDDSTPILLYVAAAIPGIGKIQVSRKTVAGDYKP